MLLPCLRWFDARHWRYFSPPMTTRISLLTSNMQILCFYGAVIKTDKDSLLPIFTKNALLVRHFALSNDYWQNLAHGRNDLQAAAIGVMPEISAMLDFLGNYNPDLLRMTGSGSAVFGIFRDGITHDRLAKMQTSLPPDWFFLP